MAKLQEKIHTYFWEGKNKTGHVIRGEQNALSVALLKADLRRQGIVANKIRQKRRPLFSRGQNVSSKDITAFTRQLSTMLGAGIPLIQAFDLIARGQSKIGLQKLVFAIKNSVEGGEAFAATLGKHPAHFSELYRNLVAAGEQSGSLDIMLKRLATYREKSESLKGKVKKALFYPTAVIAVAIIVTSILLIFVVPQFETLFSGFGADLPAMTQMVINLSRFLQAYWWIFLALIVGTIWGIIQAKRRVKKVAYTFDRLLLQIPIIGPILKKATVARFTRTLATTFGSGLPLVDALKAVSGAVGNMLYTNATLQIRDEVASGQTLQSAIRATQLFPTMVIQMVAVGEESGTLESMLSKSADIYEEEVDNAVDALSSLLEPLIMAFLGVVVGGLVVAMYLPIFKLGSVV